jgi:UDP-N-acetylmuramate dehydrogenase
MTVDEFVWAPVADRTAVAALSARLAADGVPVQGERPLGPLTTFGVGGPAALFVEAVDTETLTRTLTALADTDPDQVPLLVVGRGSNLLVGEGGFPGLAIRLGRGFAWRRQVQNQVEVGAAVSMPQLAAWTATCGLAGLEFAAAIPASVGGSVRMNAGAHGGEIVDRLVAADVADPGQPAVHRVPAAVLRLGYRRSSLPARTVVAGAVFQLRPDQPAAIKVRLDEHRAWRRRTQPLRARSCGSTFTNPPGDSAGRLIDEAGLKGRRYRSAMVSPKHANFIQADAGGSADDVYALIHELRVEVRARLGVELVPELRLIGFANPPGGSGSTSGSGSGRGDR